MRRIIIRLYKENSFFRSIVRKILYYIHHNKQVVKGHNNTIDMSKAILKNVTIEILGNNNEIILGEDVRISNTRIFIRGSGHKLIIEASSAIEKGEIVFNDENCVIRIGERTTIQEAHIAVTEPKSCIEIGDDCMFSSGIDIRNGDSHSIIDLTSGKRINFAENIIIDDRVWLGGHVQVLKGVKIGKDSIIGIRGVVTSDIPSNSIAVGIPAKVVKKDIRWTRERIYN